jgi:uncharacterized membrane protein
METKDSALGVAKIVAQGKWRFIFTYGVTAWGLSTAALYSMVMYFIYHWNALGIALSFVLFPIGGVVWGAIMWRRIKIRFDQISAPASTS